MITRMPFELYKKLFNINPNLKNVHERMGQILEDNRIYLSNYLLTKDEFFRQER